MGMINGYFLGRGFEPPRLHRTQGRPRRGSSIAAPASTQSASTPPCAFVKSKGVTFHYWERSADDLDERSTREQLRDYLVVDSSTSSPRFKADCLGWQYQLGLIRSPPAVRLRRGLFQLDLPPRVERRPGRLRHRGQARGTSSPMELMEAPSQGEGASPGGDVPRRALGRGAPALPLGALVIRLVRRHARISDQTFHARRRPLLPPTVAPLPPGGTFAGESLPGSGDDLGALRTSKTASSGWTSAKAKSEAHREGPRPRLVGRDHARAISVPWRRHRVPRDTLAGTPTCRTTWPVAAATSSARWSPSRRCSASRCAS